MAAPIEAIATPGHSEGLGVGVLTGLVGVGGAFAIMPGLVLLGNTPIKEAIGTSFLIIKPSLLLPGYRSRCLRLATPTPPDFCKRAIVNCWLLWLVKPTPENELFAVFWIGWRQVLPVRLTAAKNHEI